MKRYDLIYLFLAALSLVSGVYIGMRMGFRHDYSLVPVHVHLNLVGWTSLALFGVSFRAFPELTESRLAAVQLWFSAPSGILFPISIYVAMQEVRWPSLVFAPMWFFGTVVFATNVGCALFARSRRRSTTRPALSS
jgi:hypothetical protein